MQILTTAAIKGGTGKSTTAAAIAQAAALASKKVLGIDLDPQGNFSFFTGADQNSGNSYQLLHGSTAAELIQTTQQGIDFISASPDSATERTTPGSGKRLANALQPVKKEYDWIIIDTPPQMGELTYNALQASTMLLIPLEADNSSLQGFYQIADIARQIRQSNRRLHIAGVIVTRYDSRPKLNRYLRDVIREKANDMQVPYLLEIRTGIAIKEAQALQESIYSYAPRSKPAQDYKKLFELLEVRGNL